ncbi:MULTISPECIES: polysaccharide deacetylase family protein [Dyella]|uniref:Polysaccharide deacetylase n=2 Tax=Dyella TaxID=231454 RepID=A0A4R0YJW6_9GAMM|nr:MULTISPECIES: polysaccharide deacetylase family protein [Dyella]TBR36181.1 polysaccharide deacetylase [Dyella terrae]TCI06230.1 polysaccharide deacetylase [Dyella soli]
MVTEAQDNGRASGLRGGLGELCYSSGLLHTLQRLRAWWLKDLRVLAYHRIMPLPDPATYDFDLELISTSPERFREQMMMLRERFRPMRLSDVAQMIEAGKTIPADAVVVTFDDGYDDNYHIAFPILRELGVPATFFVSTGHIDTGKPYAYDWLVHMILLAPADARLRVPELGIDTPVPTEREERRALGTELLSRMKEMDALAQSALIERLQLEWNLPADHTPAECRPMTWDQLREMHAAGMEIGSHGVHHRMLSKLPLADMEFEVQHSRDTLLRELGPAVGLMSYPVGGDRAFDDAVVKATREAGFAVACSYICGTNPEPASNRYSLYRLPVERNMGPGWFAAMLTMPSLMSYPTASRVPAEAQAEPCSS